MSRSLLRQLEQIKQSSTYNDNMSNKYVGSVVEDVTVLSGSLEADLNYIRTHLRDIKLGFDGSDNWYDDLGKYFDPTDTDAVDVENKDMNLSNVKSNTLDSQSIIIPVVSDNSGAGYDAVSGTGGILVELTTRYATHDNLTGLPIYGSVSGTYWDEGGSLNVCAIDLLSVANNASVVDGSGNIIYGLFHDGLDYSGSGDGTDVYVRFYAAGSPVNFPGGYGTSTTVTSGGYVPPSGDDVNFDFGGAYVTPSGNQVNFDFNEYSTTGGIKIIYPHRRVMTNVAEYEWFRTDFITKVEGDPILAEDISNLWSFTGAADGDSDASGWTNTGSNWPLAGNPNNEWDAVDAVNDAFGDSTYTIDNHVVDGESLASSIDKLDQYIKDAADDASAGVGDKYVEDVSVTITANTFHQLPMSLTYTPDATSTQEGSNMDVFVNGQLVLADTGAGGSGADRDYAEESGATASGITFRFRVEAPATITYIIKE